MASEEELLDEIEEGREYGLVPDPVKDEAMDIYEQNSDITGEIFDYALETANNYWREYIQRKGEIITEGERPGVRFREEEEFSDRYLVDLATDIENEYREEISREALFELADTLTEVPDQPDNGSVHNSDPRATPENHDFPSMFQ